MPTYEYVCGACGHAFEQFQSIKAPSIKKCPECGKLKVKRLMGRGGALIFKGSGFYATDYRSQSYKDGAKKDAPPAPAAASPCDTCKKDSKTCPAKKAK
jgi:putative FmdB family regulatory protein